MTAIERVIMNNKYVIVAACLLLHGLIATTAVYASEPASALPSVQSEEPQAALSASQGPVADYSDKGADTCIKCHDEDSAFPVFSIFKSKHGQQADSRAPFAGLQCESCHGPGDNHAKRVPPGETRAPILSFAKASRLSADRLNHFSPEQQNQACLSCHQGGSHIAWQGSEHENAGIACVDCHSVHTAQDAVLSKRTQPDVCFKCHKNVRAAFYKTSVHPVRSGLMSCSACHQVHGTGADKALIKPTVNQTCYVCHAEKRGPFLWQHAPVTEDCTLCHNPHGSVHQALLKKPTVLLCKQCHAASGHPALAPSGNALPGGSRPTASAFQLLGACTNCHSQVHGSNHPSGVKGMR